MPTRFFATPEDLQHLIRAVEAKIDVQYVRFDHYDSETPEIYTSLCDFAQLGMVPNERGREAASFLVMRRGATVRPRQILLRKGGVKYAFDMELNPESVEFTPGGVREPRMIVIGRVATLMKSEVTQAIHRAFVREIRKLEQIHGVWVAPEAAKRLDLGWRLVQVVGQTPEYDLKR